MSLEMEHLTEDIDRMALVSADRQVAQQKLVATAISKLREHRRDWATIEQALDKARHSVDRKRFRAARSLDSEEPLDVGVDCPALPEAATIIGVDGSQILPDRHQAFLYSLINVGVFVYFHGQGNRKPDQYTVPTLDYPGQGEPGVSNFVDNGSVVSMRRDREEIQALSREIEEQLDSPKPLLGVLDQRLLYWPAIGAADRESDQILRTWQEAMSAIRKNGGTLTGYIARPGKRSVVTMLDALDIDEPGFESGNLEGRSDLFGLDDVHLFRELLEPGQRSKVFVEISHHNDTFRSGDPENEVCFFYLNPGRSGRQIARIDLPISAARDRRLVALVHSLIYDQCQIVGDYPYVLARADEVAVVGRQDQEHLNKLIERSMERVGIVKQVTPKLEAKEIARAGKSRHEL